MLLQLGCIILVLFGSASSAPAPSHENNATDPEFFWYMTEDGEVIKAFLSGVPTPVTLAAVEDNVEFWWYKNGREPRVQIFPGCTDCLDTFVGNAPLVVLAHGFTANHEGSFGDQFREAFSRRPEDINVVFVEWGKLAAAPDYFTAAANVDPVGKYTGQLLNFLMAQGKTTLDKVHFIGHSLGSHIGNHVGGSVSAGKIARITALDPALPLFGDKDDSMRIDPNDAVFVDVIHTAMGTLWDNGLAFTEPRGHIDFYPNSGKNQPGCLPDFFGSCSHGRANSFYAESVKNPEAFVACKCDTWEDYDSGLCLCLDEDQKFMGWPTQSSARGIYYLRTNAKSPYGQN